MVFLPVLSRARMSFEMMRHPGIGAMAGGIGWLELVGMGLLSGLIGAWVAARVMGRARVSG